MLERYLNDPWHLEIMSYAVEGINELFWCLWYAV